MNDKTKFLIDKLSANQNLSTDEYESLIKGFFKEAADYIALMAREVRQKVYGTDVYIRGLIEISNYCKNDCYYCGIRRSNKHCERYRLNKEDILDCAKNGYALGFRTFVLQGGEDPYFTDDILCDIIKSIKKLYPDTAVTLSL